MDPVFDRTPVVAGVSFCWDVAHPPSTRLSTTTVAAATLFEVLDTETPIYPNPTLVEGIGQLARI